MKKLLITILLVISSANLAFASQLPRYLGKEKKFRMFIYNPYEVYRYTGNYNYHGFIEFQNSSSFDNVNSAAVASAGGSQKKSEEILEVAIGNSSAWLWKISDSKNRLYLKPVEDDASTNMTVKTNLGRVYNFELVARTASGIDDDNLIFAFKFVYPDDTDRNILEFPKTPPSDEPDMRDLSIYNFKYDYTGEPNIAPVKVFDNGQFTYFQFPKKGGELPAIFAVDSSGYESLVNFRVAGEYVIVERVGSQFTLRNGSDIVCVYNNTMFKSGRSINPASQSGVSPLKPNYNNFSMPQISPNQISRQRPNF